MQAAQFKYSIERVLSSSFLPPLYLDCYQVRVSLVSREEKPSFCLFSRIGR